MSLKEIPPQLVLSTISPGKYSDVLPILACLLVGGPAIVFAWPYKWVYLVASACVYALIHVFLEQYRQKLRVAAALSPPESVPLPRPFDIGTRASQWNALLADYPIKSFVLFAYGTCVVFYEDQQQPVEQAKRLLETYGPAIPGTSTADMLVYQLPARDFVVGGHHPSLLTYVPRDSFVDETSSGTLIIAAGMLGKSYRVFDTFNQNVVYCSVTESDAAS